jgi:hypothetical protein
MRRHTIPNGDQEEYLSKRSEVAEMNSTRKKSNND